MGQHSFLYFKHDEIHDTHQTFFIYYRVDTILDYLLSYEIKSSR